MPEHRGWYSRGYLPHFDQPDTIQMITFRLADSLPSHLLLTWQQGLHDDAEQRRRIEAYLDAGHGSCCLRDARVAKLVEGALLYFDGQHYHLLAWVVMPNHVHVLIEMAPGHRLPDIVHSWKSFTAKAANRILGRSGALWQPEYFDRYIRNPDHFDRAVHYIHENPVKAGLALQAEEWPFSSASR
jgi:REP element-mobilizing transposase RayT